MTSFCSFIYTLTPLFGLLALPGGSLAQTPQDRAEVEGFLKHWRQSKLSTDNDLNKLRRLGKNALPLLAVYLSDKDLASYAELAMEELDAEGATPYLLKNLAQKDRSVQHQEFRIDNQRILQYDWFVRAGKPAPDPAKAPPRYPRNTRPYAYKKELHDAAVTCLVAGADPWPETQAVLSVGLTGGRHDIPLLRKYAAKSGGDSMDGSFHSLSIAAMARLGDKEAIEEITKELEKPAVSQPEQAYFLDNGHRVEATPGAKVVPEADGQRLRTAMRQAAFTMNRRFIPLLLRHLDDPPGQRHGDYSDPSPAEEAMDALGQIVMGLEYGPHKPEDWKQWRQAHQKEYP